MATEYQDADERKLLHTQLDYAIDTGCTEPAFAAQFYLLKAKSYIAQANAMKDPASRANTVATAAVFMQIATFHQKETE